MRKCLLRGMPKARACPAPTSYLQAMTSARGFEPGRRRVWRAALHARICRDWMRWISGGGEGCVGFGDGVRQVDGAGGVFDDEALEAEGDAVDGGVADAEVVGEAAEEEAMEAALAQVAGEAGRGEVVVFEEGGVGVDVAAEALA